MGWWWLIWDTWTCEMDPICGGVICYCRQLGWYFCLICFMLKVIIHFPKKRGRPITSINEHWQKRKTFSRIGRLSKTQPKKSCMDWPSHGVELQRFSTPLSKMLLLKFSLIYHYVFVLPWTAKQLRRSYWDRWRKKSLLHSGRIGHNRPLNEHFCWLFIRSY